MLVPLKDFNLIVSQRYAINVMVILIIDYALFVKDSLLLTQ
jgi:hypothetical protein